MEDKNKVVEQEEKLEQEQLKSKNKKKVAVIAAVAGGAVAVAGIAAGVVLSQPVYLDVNLGTQSGVESELSGAGKYKKGDNVTIAAQVIDGYTFEGWELNGELVSTDIEYTFVLSEKTAGSYKAVYTANESTVTVASDITNGQVRLSGTENVFATGEEVTVVVTPAEGYELTGLYYTVGTAGAPVEIENNKFTMPALADDSQITITATFGLVDYTLTNGVVADVADVTFNETANMNEQVTVTVAPRLGYNVTRLYYVDGTGEHDITSGVAFDMPASDIEIRAEYEKVLAVGKNVEGVDGVTATTSTDNFEVGQEVTLTATTTTGYTFFGWAAGSADGDIISTNLTYTFTVADGSENVYYAIFIDENAEAATFADANFNYRVLAGTNMVEIVSAVDTSATTLTIPATTTNENKTYKVVGIKDGTWNESSDGFSGGAFQNMLTLETVEFEENSNLLYVGSGAFFYTGLKEVTLPASVLRVGEAAFRSCYDMTKADFSQTQIKTIERGTFWVDNNSSMLSKGTPLTFVAPATLETIAKRAFYASELTTLDLSGCANLKSIGSEAFAGNKQLYQATLPAGTEAQPITIGTSAFANNTKLFSIKIPESVTWEQNSGTGLSNAFLGCTSLLEILDTSLADGETWTETQITNVGLGSTPVLPDGTTGVQVVNQTKVKVSDDGEFGLYEVGGVLYVVKYLGDATLYNGTVDFTKLDNLGDFALGYQIFNVGTDSDGVAIKNKITNIVFSSKITAIGDKAFTSLSGLTTIDLSPCVNLTSIGASAFQGCKNVTTLTMPAVTGTYNNVTSIGNAAFYGMTRLRKVDLSKTQITTLSTNLFQESKRIEEILLPETLITIENFALGRCDKLLTLTIPESVQTIAVNAFNGGNSSGNPLTNYAGAAHLLEVVYAGNDDTIKGQIQTAVDNICLPNGLTTVLSSGDSSAIQYVYATDDANEQSPYIFFRKGGKLYLTGFYGDYNNRYTVDLTKLNIAENYEIMANAFYDENNTLASITLSDKVTAIGDYAFYQWLRYYKKANGEVLAGEIVIPSSVTSIGKYAFATSVDNDRDTTAGEIGGLYKVTIEGNATIGIGAFNTCKELAVLTLKGNISVPSGEETYSNRFANCTKLKTLVIEDATAFENTTEANAIYKELLGLVDEIRVLKTIEDEDGATNDYLGTASRFDKVEDGDYYVYTKKA